MKKEWDERARENAMHYVVSRRDDWDEDAFFRSGLRNTQEQILSDLNLIRRERDPKQMVMLEVGCGVGRMTRHLADIFGRVEAVDVSGEMIARARENLSQCPNVGLHETNGADLASFEDQVFDFCFSFIVFQHIPSRDVIVSYLGEVHRTLKPGGVFKFQVSSGSPPEPDTWIGVGFSEQELVDLAEAIGFDVFKMRGQRTQYFWNWWIRR
jgi:ubiquinone/menaquinone biosynthesis C-methylase UbiE